MTTSPTATSPPTAQSDSRVPRWVGNRWVQGVGAGIITLVPVRRYPQWLRQAAMWVPAAGVTGVLVTPRIWRALAEADGNLNDEAGQDPDNGPDFTNDPDSAREDLIAPAGSGDLKPFPSIPRRVARWGIGLAAGASVYGYMRFALWADGAMEDRLRAAGVARPRIVLAVLGGLVTVATGRARAR